MIFHNYREIHPDGLPPSYTIILLFRLLPDTPSEAFDIWQIADKNNNPEVGVTVNRKSPLLNILTLSCTLFKIILCFFV